jgi:hypothetical protein
VNVSALTPIVPVAVGVITADIVGSGIGEPLGTPVVGGMAEAVAVTVVEAAKPGPLTMSCPTITMRSAGAMLETAGMTFVESAGDGVGYRLDHVSVTACDGLTWAGPASSTMRSGAGEPGVGVAPAGVPGGGVGVQL